MTSSTLPAASIATIELFPYKEDQQQQLHPRSRSDFCSQYRVSSTQRRTTATNGAIDAAAAATPTPDVAAAAVTAAATATSPPNGATTTGAAVAPAVRVRNNSDRSS